MCFVDGLRMCAPRMWIFTAVAVMATLSGCSDVASSKNVPTSEMYVDMNVWSFGERIILITADLKKGGSSSDTYVDLQGADRLIVSLNTPLDAAGGNDNLFDQVDAATAVHKAMDGGPEVETGIPIPFLNQSVAPYRARFDTAENGDTFIVALKRADYNDAPNSSVVLPASFAISAPTSGENFARSADLVVSWSPVQGLASVKVEAAVTCLTGTRGAWSQVLTVDTGTVIIPAATFTEPSQTCDLLIVVDRYLQGSIDANYAPGGTLLAHQSRFVSAKSIP